MCGLVGIYSSNMLNKHKEVLNSLLYLDTWRGKDSTGVAALRHNADTAILKSTVPGYEFIEGPKLDNFLRLNDFCWIGHNRFGTIGKNTKSNAHPFEVLNEDGACLLVGAHNGTLKNKHVLMDHVKFGTDSEALYNHIANTSLEDTLPLIEGAWALTYYDHEAEELRFIRNKERPLFFAFEEHKKSLFWASEQWMIRIATSRAGIKLHEDKIFTVEEDTLYRFPVPMKLNEELTFETKGGLVGKAPAFFQTGQRREWTGGATGPNYNTQPKTNQTTGSQGPTNQVTHHQTSNTQSGTPLPGLGAKPSVTSENTSSNASPNNSGNVVPIQGATTYKGFAAKPLSRTELQEQLSGGCSWCETTFITITDRHGWLDDGKPVCSKCLDGSHSVTPSKLPSININ